jgi:uncharacterized membrane protein YhaH (DUF805 family)
MTATAHDHRSHPAAFAARRWPTLLAAALSVPQILAGSSDLAGSVGSYGQALLLLPLLYLIVNQIGDARATWPVLLAGVALMVGLRLQSLVSPVLVFVTIAAVLLAWGTVRGTPHGRTTFNIQAAGTLAFLTLGLAGLAVDPEIGVYLIAAGWFFHGVWDFVHLRLNKVVSRTFAECCGVIDVLVAVELLLI